MDASGVSYAGLPRLHKVLPQDLRKHTAGVLGEQERTVKWGEIRRLPTRYDASPSFQGRAKITTGGTRITDESEFSCPRDRQGHRA